MPDDNLETLQINNTIKSEYIYPGILKRNPTINSNKFSLLHLNIRSLHKQYDAFLDYLHYQSINIDCIVLSETFLNKHNSKNYPIPWYSDFHLYRDNKRGSGVSIYVKTSLCTHPKIILSQMDEHIEALGIRLKMKQTALTIAAIYRPPNQSKNEFINSLKTLMNHHHFDNKTIYAGDFNIDTFHNNNNLLTNLMTSSGFANYITLPTRPTNNNNGTLLDHIWGNLPLKANSYIIKTDITDHYPCLVTFTIEKNDQTLYTIKYRPDSQNLQRAFVEKINDINFSFINDTNLDINTKSDQLVTSIYNCYDETFPIKTKTVGQKNILNPWITKELHKNINEKHL